MPRPGAPTNLREDQTVDVPFRDISAGTERDLAQSLLGSTEDACLLFVGKSQ
jgi:hypothetical protein